MLDATYRKRRGSQRSLGRPWLEIDIKLIRLMAGTTRPRLIAKLFDRSYESLRQMAKREGIQLRVEPKKPAMKQQPSITELCRANWQGYSIHKIFGSGGKHA
ncbi:hypothetical protein [Dryocola clanedunensis]